MREARSSENSAGDRSMSAMGGKQTLGKRPTCGPAVDSCRPQPERLFFSSDLRRGLTKRKGARRQLGPRRYVIDGLSDLHRRATAAAHRDTHPAEPQEHHRPRPRLGYAVYRRSNREACRNIDWSSDGCTRGQANIVLSARCNSGARRVCVQERKRGPTNKITSRYQRYSIVCVAVFRNKVIAVLGLRKL